MRRLYSNVPGRGRSPQVGMNADSSRGCSEPFGPGRCAIGLVGYRYDISSGIFPVLVKIEAIAMASR
ncbi:hypothetical protein NDI52_20680 [Leptolyngbya sp. PL-A3]